MKIKIQKMHAVISLFIFTFIVIHSIDAFSSHNETQDIAMRMIMTGANTHYEHQHNTNQYTINVQTPGYIRRSLYNVQSKTKELSNDFYFKWRPGPHDFTNRPLDFAIDAKGKGFFVVQLPHSIGYTRDGRCRIDHQGRLVLTAGNYPLLGENGFITLDNDRITVNSAGTIFDENGRRVDQIKVVVFKSTKQMDSLTTPNGVIFLADEVLDVVEGRQYYRVRHRWLETPNTLRAYDSNWAKHAYTATVKTGHAINSTYRTAASLSQP